MSTRHDTGKVVFTNTKPKTPCPTTRAENKFTFDLPKGVRIGAILPKTKEPKTFPQRAKRIVVPERKIIPKTLAEQAKYLQEAFRNTGICIADVLMPKFSEGGIVPTQKLKPISFDYALPNADYSVEMSLKKACCPEGFIEALEGKKKKEHVFTILERKDIEIKSLTDKVTALTLHINLVESFILEKRAERLNK